MTRPLLSPLSFLFVFAATLSLPACAEPTAPPPLCPSPPPAPTAAPPTRASAPLKITPADLTQTPSADRGHWTMPPDDRWRSAMDGYVAVVTPHNPRALGDARLAFATYLNAVHNALHPWFADRFLAWVDARPMGDPLADSRLAVRIELAIAPDGTIARMGVVKSSGLPAFDASGLEAFAKGAPYPPTPPEIRSADGNVWAHWELRRDEVYACSTMNVRPFVIGP